MVGSSFRATCGEEPGVWQTGGRSRVEVACLEHGSHFRFSFLLGGVFEIWCVESSFFLPFWGFRGSYLPCWLHTAYE